MLEIRLLEARGEAEHATAHDIFGADFLIRRPLLQALESTDGVAPVLLIDEIDRADEEFEAYLLEILSDFQVTVPEIGTIKADTPPRVILTSNRTREVHDALKRRCLYHWIDYPTGRLHQDDRRVQLHRHRHRHGARLPLGAIQFPLPAIGKISLGLSGVLIMALVLGKLRRTRGMSWTIPLSANLVIRNLGLTLFLAQVGMASGPKFAATVTETGFMMLGLGVVVLVALVVPILILGLFVFQMPYDEVAGIVAGACGNPAILAYSNKLTPTDRPDIGYAMIFPRHDHREDPLRGHRPGVF